MGCLSGAASLRRVSLLKGATCLASATNLYKPLFSNLHLSLVSFTKQLPTESRLSFSISTIRHQRTSRNPKKRCQLPQHIRSFHPEPLGGTFQIRRGIPALCQLRSSEIPKTSLHQRYTYSQVALPALGQTRRGLLALAIFLLFLLLQQRFLYISTALCTRPSSRHPANHRPP